MIAGVQTNSQRRNRPYTAITMDNLTTYDNEQADDDEDKPDMTQLMNVILYFPKMIQRNTQKLKLLQTQVPIFEGNKERYNELEHILFNHISPFQEENAQKENLQFFKSLLSEDAFDFWQTTRVTPDTTLRQVLEIFRKNLFGMILRRFHDTVGINSNKSPNTNLSLISLNT